MKNILNIIINRYKLFNPLPIHIDDIIIILQSKNGKNHINIPLY